MLYFCFVIILKKPTFVDDWGAGEIVGSRGLTYICDVFMPRSYVIHCHC